MHTERTQERRGLTALLGLAVAGATLMAGMVALPVSKAAAAYPADDEWKANIDPAAQPKLTVTKYLSTEPGAPATGSIADQPAPGSGHNPAVDVIFNVYEVVPVSGNYADIDPTNPGTFTKADPSEDVYAGQTDIDGVINSWFKADGTGRPTSTPLDFKKGGVFYYVMEEKQDISPSFMPGGRYNGKGYKPAQNSFFSLPYRTQTGDAGYLYHLHLFPKNVNDSDLSKQVMAFTDSDGTSKGVIAKPGDTIRYRLNQRLYNEGTAVAGDNKLDVAELGVGSPTNLKVVDRVTTALRVDKSSISVKLTGGTDDEILADGGDYTLDADSITMPKDYEGKDLFPTDPGAGTKYWTFEFFNNVSKIQGYAQRNNTVKQFTLQIQFTATVTADGDSTGASQGTIRNVVRSTNTDKGTHDNPEGTTDTPAATSTFGKVNSSGAPVSGAVFRLVDEKDDTKFLASDGQTYTEHDPAMPGTATFYTATSNNQGVVAFSALPIMTKKTDTTPSVGRAGNWRIQEITAPTGYERPMILFSKVSFAAKPGETDYIVGKTAEEIVKHFVNMPIESTHDYLSFGRYNHTPAAGQEISVGGHVLDNYLANFKHGEPGAPINLPLTGGRGIVLLLVVGLVVMGAALYARNRRNAVRA